MTTVDMLAGWVAMGYKTYGTKLAIVRDEAEEVSQGGIIIPDTFDEITRTVAINAIRESCVYGFRWAMGICAVSALAGALVSLVWVRNATLRQATSKNLPP